MDGYLTIPSGVQKHLVKIARNFLWGNSEEHHKKARVAWRDICKPKKERGLGIFDLNAWNKALLIKHLCNIQCKKDSLWVRWMHHYYRLHEGSWEQQSKPSFSVFFKRLLLIKELLVSHYGSTHNAVLVLQSWVDGNGSLTSKAYDFFRDKGRRTHWASIVWSPTITLKHSFVFWLAVRDRLPTRDKLHFVVTDSSCPSCGSHLETQDHLLFHCSLAQDVWRRVLNWLCIPNVFPTLKNLIRWTLKHARRRSTRTKFIKVTFACTIYCLWISRNKKIFEDQVSIAQDVAHRIVTHVYRIFA